MRWRREAVDPKWDVEQLLRGVSGVFRLEPERDLRVLGLLFDHNFLAAEHFWKLREFDGIRSAQRRLAKMMKAGLVARIKTSLGDGHWRYTYSLTSFGARALRDLGYIENEALLKWRPIYERQGWRNNPEHDSAVADLCVGIIEYLGDRFTTAWYGARSVVSTLGQDVVVNGRRVVSPDSIVIVIGGNRGRTAVAIEYESSVRPNTIISKLDGYVGYFLSKPWRKKHSGLTAPPVVLLSVASRSDKQKYWDNPFSNVQRIGKGYPALTNHVFLLDEVKWRAGLWSVEPLGGTEPRELHAVFDEAGVE